MRILATGDAILTRKLSALQDPAILRIRELFGEADVTITNLESPLPGAERVPGLIPKGMHVFAEDFVVDELQWLGVDMANLANNHAVDYTLNGLITTMKTLRAAGLPFAGAGMTLGAARAPEYFDTPQGRVAMIGACSSAIEIAVAADARSDMAGRAGIAPLRHKRYFEVDQSQFDAVSKMHEELGVAATQKHRVAASKSRAGSAGGSSVQLGDAVFRVADEIRVTTEPDARDVEAIEKAIALARAQADIVVINLHAHEGSADGWNSEDPADFIGIAARRWIDAGAHAIIGHGPHCLRGIEIYNGAPIMYSLGNFIFTLETVEPLPAEAYEQQGLDPFLAKPSDFHDAAVFDDDGKPKGFLAARRFWETVLADLRIEDGAVVLELIPVGLTQTASRGQRGIPYVAEGAEAEAILRKVDELSAPFGTTVRIERRGDDVRGVVETLAAT